MNKGPLALRTISETADVLGVQQHVLRFWETKFTFIRPTKRAGGRRFYRPQDLDILLGVKALLYDRGYTIRGVQMLFKDEGLKAILNAAGEGGSAEVKTETAVSEDAVPSFASNPDAGDVSGSLSDDVRARFLDIAQALEAAQAALGRQLGKA
ncbi:MAG: MerR family transcriptional regulator [Asticcacaulis sp.]